MLDPGLGKTSILLAIFSVLKSMGYVDRMLVIAPIKPIYLTWPNEIEKWKEFNHLTYHIIHGKTRNFWEYEDADIYLVNPEGMKWLEPHLLKLQCDVLAVDESTKFKNSTSKRFKMLRRFIPKFARRYIATGTVCPNGLLDLFGQMYILDEGHALGRYITHYRKKWFTPDWSGYNWEANDNAMGEITTAIAPLCLQLNAEDHIDMPELMETDILVQLPPDVMKLYKEIENEYIASLPETNTELVAASDAAAGTKCRQICNGAVYTDGKMWEPVHNEKINALVDILDQIGELPVILVYEFQHDKERIMAAVEGCECMTGVFGDALRDMEHRFNLGMINRLVVHASGTAGLNLQGPCSHMVWLCMPWDLEAYMQTIYRLYRQGQKATIVMVYRILAEDTLDLRVVRILKEKEEEQNEVGRRIADYRR